MLNINCFENSYACGLDATGRKVFVAIRNRSNGVVAVPAGMAWGRYHALVTDTTLMDETGRAVCHGCASAANGEVFPDPAIYEVGLMIDDVFHAVEVENAPLHDPQKLSAILRAQF